MSFNDTQIRDLIHFTDPQGVLTFTVGHTPAQAADPQPTTPIELRNQVKALLGELAEKDPDTARAVERRIDHLDAELDDLLDPSSSGRGRALYVAVGSGETERLTLQVPLPDRVVHDTSAYVRPLVAALDEGRPAGVLVVTGDHTRLLRWTMGDVEELDASVFELSDDAGARDKAGPSPGNPRHPHHGFVDRDRFEDRVEENRFRHLRDVAEDTLARAKEEGWDRLVVSAPPKLRESMRSLLEVNGGPRIVVADTAWEEAPRHHLAVNTWELLRTVRRDREQDLVDTVLERALGGGAGALGLDAVCAALNEGRVSRLLYDAELDLEGYVGADGTLYPPTAEVDDARLDRLFVERLLEKSLTTSASVTPLGADTAAPLGPYDRVGAILRW